MLEQPGCCSLIERCWIDSQYYYCTPESQPRVGYDLSHTRSTLVLVQIFHQKQRATHKIISSARLPREMLRRAPAVSPRSWANLSVAKVSVIDKGMIAIKFQMKTTSAGTSRAEKTIATSAKTSDKEFLNDSRTLSWLLKAIKGLSQAGHPSGWKDRSLLLKSAEAWFLCRLLLIWWEMPSLRCATVSCSSWISIKALAFSNSKHEWFRNDPRFEDHFLNRCSLPKLRSEAQSEINPASSSVVAEAPRPTLWWRFPSRVVLPFVTIMGEMCRQFQSFETRDPYSDTIGPNLQSKSYRIRF